jgi:hypothetical protein
MKIKINTKAKTIQVEGKVNKTELNKVLSAIFPAGKLYEVESVLNINHWSDPIVYNENIPLKIAEYRDIYNIEA